MSYRLEIWTGEGASKRKRETAVPSFADATAILDAALKEVRKEHPLATALHGVDNRFLHFRLYVDPDDGDREPT